MSEVSYVTIKVDETTKKKMINFYKYNMNEKIPPYAIFQATSNKVTVTLYESLKCLFQGANAKDEASIWLSDNHNTSTVEKKEKLEKKTVIDYNKYNIIGSDEVGTGDYFGPIVVCAVYLKKELVSTLIELGVNDSKKLTDKFILEVVPQFISLVDSEVIILSNKQYNEYSSINMNKMKAILHNKVLLALSKKNKEDTNYILIDQFTTPRSYYEYLSGLEKPTIRTCFETKGETVSLAVACASMIARYNFLKQMDKLNKKVGVKLPLGASDLVDKVGRDLYLKYGKEYLSNIAKINFKNTSRIVNE